MAFWGLNATLWQGRSPLLPTLPFQQTNRYAVVGITIVSYPKLINSRSYKSIKSQRISLPSPLGEGLGVRPELG